LTSTEASLGHVEIPTTFKTLISGCVEILQKVLPKIQAAKNPSIVMFSTVAVKLGMPFHSSVSSSKGAIEGLTRALAAEFAPKIRVNTIAPSILETPMSEKFLNSETKLDNAKNRHPLKEIGSAKDISEVVKFLLEDNSKWMTGQIIPIDGGMSSVKTN
jgi:NAD(P)-dependent dehydrogenase (short-subunit alcohol dehydrogenase family)